MKKVLVTGGSRGIGKAITEKFLEHGYEVTAPTRPMELETCNLSFWRICASIFNFESFIASVPLIWALFKFSVLSNALKNVRISSLFFEAEHPARLSDKKQVKIIVNIFFIKDSF